MKTSTKVFVSVVLLAVVALIGFRMTGNVVADSGIYDEFAQCLTDKDVKMYGAYWCPHCQEQKKLFGGSWDKVDYVECSLPNRAGQTQICIREKINSYPTWEFSDGSRVSGKLSMQDLSLKTGCALPSLES